MVSVSALPCGREQVLALPGHTKDHNKMVQSASLLGTHALWYEFDSAVRLSKRPGSVWNCHRDMHQKDLLGSIARKG